MRQYLASILLCSDMKPKFETYALHNLQGHLVNLNFLILFLNIDNELALFIPFGTKMLWGGGGADFCARVCACVCARVCGFGEL